MYNLYRKTSPFLKSMAENLGLARGKCRFNPTCSAYSKQAVETHGLVRGSFLAAKRVLKCHPLHPGGDDPVPPKNK